MSRPKSPKIAIIQHPPAFLNLAASMDRALELIAGVGDADVIVFPETWLPGYPVWIDFAPGAALWDQPGAKALYRILLENAVIPGDENLVRLQKAADDSGAVIAMGAHERAGGTLYNTFFLFSPGGKAPLPHRKLTPTYTEKLLWGAGDGSTLDVIETPFGKVGGLICWEHWMPLARAALHAKGEVLHIAQWPAVKEMHLVASRHYAFEGRCFVAAAGTCLSKDDVMNGFASLSTEEPEAHALLASIPDGLIHNGGSAIIGPDGGYIAGPLFDQAGVLTATLDLAMRAENKMTLDTAGHYARPDIFELTVDTREKSGVKFSTNHGR